MTGGFSAVDLRRMLSRLRDVMAGAGSVQERLDKMGRAAREHS